MNYIITMKDIKKYEILLQLIKKDIKGSQAASLLGYTQVHISRLKQTVIKYGFEGLLRVQKKSPRKIPEKTKNNIIKLYKKYYYDFNILHFKDKLNEIHSIDFSYETIRSILMEKHLHIPKKKKIVHRRRRRMPKAGMLIQMDSSQHHWIPSIKEKWWLTLSIDDATNKIPFAKLYPSDGVFNNMDVIRKTIESEGLFYSLYVDKASHFRTTRYGGIHVNLSEEVDNTHIERALKELNINLLLANSPQAKGRVERVFRLFQDRFIKELRLNNIRTYNEANSFLNNKFLPYYNNKFTDFMNIKSSYKPLAKNINLDLVFSKKYQRKVYNDNTIRFDGFVIQIPPTKYRISFAKCIVDVHLLDDNRVFILFKNKLILATKISKNNKVYRFKKQVEQFLNQRDYQNIAI